MSLAILFTPIRSPGDIEWMLLANEALHNQVNRAIFTQKSKQMISLPLRPLVPADVTGWALRHYAMHSQVNSTLGTAGNDLAVLDFENPEQLASWGFLHATEHRTWNITLGL